MEFLKAALHWLVTFIPRRRAEITVADCSRLAVYWDGKGCPTTAEYMREQVKESQNKLRKLREEPDGTVTA